MKNDEKIRNVCERNSRISERVVDDFLLNYAAGHRGLEKKMTRPHARFWSHSPEDGGRYGNLRYMVKLVMEKAGSDFEDATEQGQEYDQGEEPETELYRNMKSMTLSWSEHL